MQLSLFRLALVVLALLVVAVAAETNAERMSRGLPPLPPRWLVKHREQQNNEHAETDGSAQPESRPEMQSRTESEYAYLHALRTSLLTPTPAAEPRHVSLSPNTCMVDWALPGTRWCCRRKYDQRLSSSFCYPADSWGRWYVLFAWILLFRWLTRLLFVALSTITRISAVATCCSTYANEGGVHRGAAA